MGKAEYTVIRSRRKTMGLSLDGEGNVVVRAPIGVPTATIERFVRESSGWIEKQRAKLKKTNAEAEAMGALTREDLRRLADEMLKVLYEKLPHFAGLVGVTYGRVTVRNQRSKWGSCTAQGNLNFNCLLMLAPEEVLDYVIVHELCHRKHMDHSKEFWAEVERACPGYKAQKKWLKDNGGTLMRRANG